MTRPSLFAVVAGAAALLATVGRPARAQSAPFDPAVMAESLDAYTPGRAVDAA